MKGLNNMQKISKNYAQNAYKLGLDVILVPSTCNTEEFFTGIVINKSCGKSFAKAVKCLKKENNVGYSYYLQYPFTKNEVA